MFLNITQQRVCVCVFQHIAYIYLDIIPFDFVAEPVVGGESNGQQSHGHNGRDGRQRQRYRGARHIGAFGGGGG